MYSVRIVNVFLLFCSSSRYLQSLVKRWPHLCENGWLVSMGTGRRAAPGSPAGDIEAVGGGGRSRPLRCTQCSATHCPSQTPRPALMTTGHAGSHPTTRPTFPPTRPEAPRLNSTVTIRGVPATLCPPRPTWLRRPPSVLQAAQLDISPQPWHVLSLVAVSRQSLRMSACARVGRLSLMPLLPSACKVWPCSQPTSLQTLLLPGSPYPTHSLTRSRPTFNSVP